MQDED